MEFLTSKHEVTQDGRLITVSVEEKKAVIEAALKPIFAKYKIKSSLKVRSQSSFALTIRQGALDLRKDWRNNPYTYYDDVCYTKPYFTKYLHKKYWLGLSLEFFEEFEKVMTAASGDYYVQVDIENYKLIK